MNWAIWKKAISDAWPQLAVTGGLLMLFGWVFVWLTSLLKLGLWANFVNLLPDFVRDLVGVSVIDLASLEGRLSFLYLHGITVFLCLFWSIGRGSDSVSGGISSGHLELIVTLPVWRVSVLVVPAIVATLGAAILAAAVWLGNAIGLMTVELESQVSVWLFLPGAANLFAMTFCMAGVATLLSSWDRDRWRTIWLAGGFYVVSGILKMIGLLWEPGGWLCYLSFLTAFEPQQLILMREEAWRVSLWYNLPLMGLGLIAYAAATVVFCRRDIPVPR